MLKKITKLYPEEKFLKVDGFDKAIIGIEEKSKRLVYSVSGCLKILEKEMKKKDAIDYFEFNIYNSFIGEESPIWCYDDF
jgi:hypothetical protein